MNEQRQNPSRTSRRNARPARLITRRRRTLQIAIATTTVLASCSWNDRGDITKYERAAHERIDNYARATDCAHLTAELERARRDGRYLSPVGPPHSDLANYIKAKIAATRCG